MTDTELELKNLNENATLLLTKYDGAGFKLDENLRLALISISEKIASFSSSGTFTATLNGKSGNSNTGTDFSKTVNGKYHLIGDRVFISFLGTLINGAEVAEFTIRDITGLPFEALEKSVNGTIYGRGLKHDYAGTSVNSFVKRVSIDANTSRISVNSESTTSLNSGWIKLRTNDSGSRISDISINYRIKV